MRSTASDISISSPLDHLAGRPRAGSFSLSLPLLVFSRGCIPDEAGRIVGWSVDFFHPKERKKNKTLKKYSNTKTIGKVGERKKERKEDEKAPALFVTCTRVTCLSTTIIDLSQTDRVSISKKQHRRVSIFRPSDSRPFIGKPIPSDWNSFFFVFRFLSSYSSSFFFILCAPEDFR